MRPSISSLPAPVDVRRIHASQLEMSEDELMTSAEVASLIRVPAATLRYWRYIGIGPKSFKMGPRRVLYRRQDVQDWVAAQYAERR